MTTQESRQQTHNDPPLQPSNTSVDDEESTDVFCVGVEVDEGASMIPSFATLRARIEITREKRVLQEVRTGNEK